MEKTNIYDLSEYRTEKILSGTTNYEEFQILGTSHNKLENASLYKILIKEILNKKSILVLTQKNRDLFVKELLAYITEENILEDSIKLYNLIYNSKIFIINNTNITEIWLEAKKIEAHRTLDYIMVEDYNIFKDARKELESISSELSINILAFI